MLKPPQLQVHLDFPEIETIKDRKRKHGTGVKLA